VAVAAISELGLVALTSARFVLGFYAGRLFSLVTSTTVLVVLLAETSRLYGRLARSNVMLQSERQNKLMNLEAMAASISHEVRQPLAGIATNGRAALRFLGHLPPNVEEAQSALKRLIGDSHRASGVFDNIRALFGKADQGHEPIDVNELIHDVVASFQADLAEHGITAVFRLQEALPKIVAHKGQLQQVLINLVRNAIEAMQTDKNDHTRAQGSTLSMRKASLMRSLLPNLMGWG